jgi:hypothetical protein
VSLASTAASRVLIAAMSAGVIGNGRAATAAALLGQESIFEGPAVLGTEPSGWSSPRLSHPDLVALLRMSSDSTLTCDDVARTTVKSQAAEGFQRLAHLAFRAAGDTAL